MKNSDRVKKTKELIINTYIELVESEGMSNVTVSKLCEKADISRPTFYNYYQTLEEPLEEALHDLFSQINSEAVHNIIIEPNDEFIFKYIDYYKQSSPLLRRLMNGKSPEFEYFFQCKLFQNIPKPKNYDTDYEAQVAYDLMNAVQYTLLKLVIFNPELPNEYICDIYKKTTTDFAAKKYTSSF